MTYPVSVRLPLRELIAQYQGESEWYVRALRDISALQVVVPAPQEGWVEHVRYNPAAVGAVIGVTSTSAQSGQLITVRRSGVISDDSWSWFPGRPVGLAADWTLTQTPPASGVWCVVAYAVSVKQITIRIASPVALA